MKTFLTLSVLFIFTSLVFTHNAFADTCSYSWISLTAPQLFLVSDTVFAGTVSSIDNYTSHEWKIEFNTEKIWKGQQGPKISIITNSLRGCDYTLTIGEKYLVYASNSPLHTTLDLTVPFSGVQNDTKIFDDPKFQTEQKIKEELNKKLEIAKEIISNMMVGKTTAIPINMVGVDEINSILEIGIDNTKAALSEEEYQKKLKEMVGDIPIKIEFGVISPTSKSTTENFIGNDLIPPSILTPLKQLKFGIPLTEIKCKENLTLLKKTSNGLAICVSIKTGKKLLERKFAQPIASTAPLESMKKSDSKNTNEPYTTIEISFGNATTTKLLPVVFSEITHNAEYIDEILVWNFELIGHDGDDRRKTWDTVSNDQRVFYKITDEYGTNVIDNTRMPDNIDIPADLHLYSMDCGLFQTVDGESAHPTVFAVKKGTPTIIAKNSNKGILPMSDGKYSFEFASIFETTVKLPKNAEIISQESKQCKLVQGIEGDADRTYTNGYYTKMVFSLEN